MQRMEGVGNMQYENKETYEGHFVAGLRDGQGIYKYSSGSVYDGSWSKGVFSGEGTFRFSSRDNESGEAKSSTYKGCFVDGKRKGYGVMSYANGDTYAGWLVL